MPINPKLISDRRGALESQFPIWPRDTLATHFSKSCIKYSERPFIYIEGATITYSEVWENALKYAKSLLNLGVKRRDHIAILMENDLAYPSLMIASSLIGAVFIPINTMLGEDELEYILCQSDAQFLIAHQNIKGNHHGNVIAKLLGKPVFRSKSQLKQVICIHNEDDQLDDRFQSWDDFCKGSESVKDEEIELRWKNTLYPDEIAVILYTSGSTGKPKGVMLTNDMLLRSSYSTCLSRAIEDGRVTFAPLPFYHCFAIVEGILAMSFVGGAVVSASKFTPLSALQMMEKFQANDFLCVPSMLVPF